MDKKRKGLKFDGFVKCPISLLRFTLYNCEID